MIPRPPLSFRTADLVRCFLPAISHATDRRFTPHASFRFSQSRVYAAAYCSEFFGLRMAYESPTLQVLSVSWRGFSVSCVLSTRPFIGHLLNGAITLPVTFVRGIS